MATADAQHYLECDGCETKPAQHYCVTCLGNLCDACHEIHLKQKLTKNHEIQPLSWKSKFVKYGVCREHPSRKLEVFCKPCHIPVCPQCLVEKHNGHELENIDMIYQLRYEEAQKMIIDINSHFIPAFESCQTESEKQEQEMDEDIKRLYTDMKSQTQIFIDLIRKIEKDYCVSLQSSHQMEKEACRSRQAEIKDRISRLKEIKEKISRDVNQHSSAIFYMEDATNLEKMKKLPDSVIYTLPIFSAGTPDIAIISRQYGKVSDIKSTVLPGKSVASSDSCPGNETQTMTVVQQTACLTTDLEEQYEVRCVGRTKIAVRGNDRNIRILCLDGKQHGTITTDTEQWPDGMTVMNDSSILYSEKKSKRIMKVTEDGKSHEIIKSENFLKDISTTSCGHILACLVYRLTSTEDDQKGKVVKYAISGDVIKEFDSLYKRPFCVTENKGNKDIVVSDLLKYQVITIDEDGKYRYTYDGGVSRGREGVFGPRNLDSDYNGRVLIADQHNHSIHLISKDGDFISFILTKDDGLFEPFGVSFDGNISMWVSEKTSKKVKCFQYLQRGD